MTFPIEKEWRWEGEEAAKGGIWFREFLIWRGIVLASVEGGDERFFGNLGIGSVIEDWEARVAHSKDRIECKKEIEKRLLERLTNGLKDG